MADEGGIAPAAAANTHDNDISHIHPPVPQILAPSRRSTLSKSGFEMYASGVATPMTGGKRSSGMDFDDYFVCSHFL